MEKEGALSVGSYSNEDGNLLNSLNEKLSDYLVAKKKGKCTSDVPTCVLCSRKLLPGVIFLLIFQRVILCQFLK